MYNKCKYLTINNGHVRFPLKHNNKFVTFI